MPIKKNVGRQELIVATMTIDFSDPTAYGTAEDALDLPGGAVVTGGDVVVITPWNSATSATLSLGDVADADRYAAAVDLKTAGRTALTVTGYQTPIAESIKALLTQAGAGATVGLARVTVHYYVQGRSAFTQG